MQKIFICLLAALLMAVTVACSFRPADGYVRDTESESESESESVFESESESEKTVESESESESELPTVRDPLPIGIYNQKQNGVESYGLVTEMKGMWYYGMEIACFAILPSTDETVSGTAGYKKLWQDAYDANIPDKSARLGFVLVLNTSEGSETLMIRNADDSANAAKSGYVQIYIYDDLHQATTWYSHLKPADFNAETLISSFKIVAGEKFASVESISLSAYWYVNDGNGESDTVLDTYTAKITVGN